MHLQSYAVVAQQAVQQQEQKPSKHIQQLCDKVSFALWLMRSWDCQQSPSAGELAAWLQVQHPAVLAFLRGQRHLQTLHQSSLQLLSKTLPLLLAHEQGLQKLLQALLLHCSSMAQAAGTGCE